MIKTVAQIVFLLSIAVFLLVDKPTVKEVGKWFAGVSALVWAFALLVPVL